MNLENELSKTIIGCAIEVHKVLGPGLLESAYRDGLLYEFQQRNIQVKKEQIVPLIYKGEVLESKFRLDLLVENKVIIELKAVESLNEVHLAQTLSYLRLTNCKLGLLINFNVALLKNGVKRIINDR